MPSKSAKAGKPSWKPITPDLVKELSRRSNERMATNEEMQEIQERIMKMEERNGVVHLAELMAEQQEERDKRNQEPDEANAENEATESTEDEAVEVEVVAVEEDDELDEDEVSIQQTEAVQVLIDLIQLSTSGPQANG